MMRTIIAAVALAVTLAACQTPSPRQSVDASADPVRAKCYVAAEAAVPRPTGLVTALMHRERVDRWIDACVAAGGPPADLPAAQPPPRSDRTPSSGTVRTYRMPFDHALRQCRTQSRMVFPNSQFMRDQAERDCLRGLGY